MIHFLLTRKTRLALRSTLPLLVGLTFLGTTQNTYAEKPPIKETKPIGKKTKEGPTISVVIDLDSSRSSPISPGIYGLGTYLGEKQSESHKESLNPETFRLGGNSSERYNWKLSSWNAGKDWYFRNFPSDTPNPVEDFMKKNQARGAGPLVTIPLLGWVAKDSSSGSYPLSKFPKQEKMREGFGNGIDSKGNPLKADPQDANTPFGPEQLSAWVSKLKLEFGHHPHRYILGNEPMLWHETHQDVHPTPATYDQVLAKYLGAAIALRKADPEAVIFGPALWGFLAVKQSACDAPGPWSGGKKMTDKAQHGGVDFLEWFLKEVAKEEARLKVSLLDVVDVHYYPEGHKIRQAIPSLPDTRKARIGSTRSLWDKSYRDPSWLNRNLYFIPYLKEVIKKTGRERRLAIGEYNFYGEQDLAGGIALAEVLGIFSREKLDYANYWTVPPENSPADFAFKLFRNYDGKKSSFGETLIPNSVGIQEEVSVFSSLRKKDSTVTLVLLNKSQTAQAHFKIDFQPIMVATSNKNPRHRLSLPSAKLFIYVPETKKIEHKAIDASALPPLGPLAMALLELKIHELKN